MSELKRNDGQIGNYFNCIGRAKLSNSHPRLPLNSPKERKIARANCAKGGAGQINKNRSAAIMLGHTSARTA